MLVYKTTNLVNGKIYIGQTSDKVKGYLGSGILLRRAIKKYGPKDFTRETICECWCQEVMDKLEAFYIKYFDAQNPDIGYNISDGGTNPMLGKKHTKESKAKMSDSRVGEKNHMYGKKHTKESIKKMQESHKGELHNWYGKKHTYATKEKMREAHSGSKNSMYGKTLTKETKDKMSKSHLGSKNYMYGRTHTKEARQKISDANSGKNSHHYNKKGNDSFMYGRLWVYCLNTNKTRLIEKKV